MSEVHMSEVHMSEVHMSEVHMSEIHMSEAHTSKSQTHDGYYSVDTEKLERILGNILMNSMAYTPPGGRIEIKLQAENRILRFLVRDTGPGFAPGDWGKVFDRFYRSDKARGIGEGHSGLGLYIAKRLVQQHGGDITACNADGGGAEIVFSIQASQSE
ncbi:sensor histidine kinase [Paenibacillus sp. CN-4]|uniref:sensor histidine kinase n=1 Tax=Paenibacillus nanchangensis TaxID=3348343 RepID=UPI00397D0E94